MTSKHHFNRSTLSSDFLCVNYGSIKTLWLLFLTAVLLRECFQGDKECIIRGIISEKLYHCLSFIFGAWLSVISAAWLRCRRPLQKLTTVSSWDFLRQSISKPKCLSCALTTQTPGAFGNRRLDAGSLGQSLLDYRLGYMLSTGAYSIDHRDVVFPPNPLQSLFKNWQLDPFSPYVPKGQLHNDTDGHWWGSSFLSKRLR